MKIVWLSANKLGYELLKEIIKHTKIKVDTAITLSNISKTKMYDMVGSKIWHKLGLRVFEIEQINNEIGLLRRLKPDLIIMCGWRQVLCKEIIDYPRLGVIGFHPTLLPYGRGPAPIINTILAGNHESGLTMFYVTERLDEGNIIAQIKFKIQESDHANEVYQKIIKAGKALIRDYLPSVITAGIPSFQQNDTHASTFKKPSFCENEIKLEKDTLEQVYRKIKAFSKPYKGAFIKQGSQRLIIWKAELENC